MGGRTVAKDVRRDVFLNVGLPCRLVRSDTALAARGPGGGNEPIGWQACHLSLRRVRERQYEARLRPTRQSARDTDRNTWRRRALRLLRGDATMDDDTLRQACAQLKSGYYRLKSLVSTE